MADLRPKLLWTDDDGPNRFEYERYLIDSCGWSVSWAANVLQASEKLAGETFNALILDQMIPYQGDERGPLFPWGGCLLLHWLRGTYPPKRAPIDDIPPGKDLGQRKPHPDNQRLRVMVVSAFHDDDVLTALRGASDLDRHLSISSKPTSDKKILDFLRHA
jgi:hypothetical protein